MQQISQKEAFEMLKRKYGEQFPYEIYDELDYYSWPKVYGSTAGPFGGCGGQSFTTFQIEAWSDGYFGVLFCGNKVLKVCDKFEMGMRV